MYVMWILFKKIFKIYIFLVAKYNDLSYYSGRFKLFVGRMAELVDALVSGTSGSNTLEVRVFLSAPVLGL